MVYFRQKEKKTQTGAIMMSTYEIRYKDLLVATIDHSGHVQILSPDFMPYGLELTSSEGFDVLLQNIYNFYHWCAGRLLPYGRRNATAMLNSVAFSHGITDKARAKNALAYHCLSMTDVYWVCESHEVLSFADINLFENHPEEHIDIALCGKQYAVEPCSLARDLSTAGCSPKAWQFRNGRFCLLKGGDGVERELLASQICRCFAVDQVFYNETVYREERVSMCENITSLEYSIVSMASFKEHLVCKGLDPHEFILRLDPKNYYMMNIIDYLVGNTDRHMGNWGVLVDNVTNQPLRLHNLLDFNQAFRDYGIIEGGACQATFGNPMTQKEAAIMAVKAIGLNQIHPIDSAIFDVLPQYKEMFYRRLSLLQSIAFTNFTKK